MNLRFLRILFILYISSFITCNSSNEKIEQKVNKIWQHLRFQENVLNNLDRSYSICPSDPIEGRSESVNLEKMQGNNSSMEEENFLHLIYSNTLKTIKNISLEDYLEERNLSLQYSSPIGFQKPNLTKIGEANVEMIKRVFRNSLDHIRNHENNQALKEKSMKTITDQLNAYALEIYNQEFMTKTSNGTELKGVNIIAVIPGKNRNKPGDRILLIGAHYDTVKNSPGVDDNGSGVAALIELTRICSGHIGQFTNTIFFVAFDLQETGILGSMAFVNNYLIPQEILGKKAKFIGAYILDMVMHFDSRPRSQSIPLDIATVVPEASAWMRANNYAGDFLSVWSRRVIDWHLWESFSLAWKDLGNETTGHPVKLLALDPPISRAPFFFTNWIYRTFLKSDHAAFWQHKNRQYAESLYAVLLTDMGPWRGKQTNCYHAACDNKDFLTTENLKFLKKVIDALAKTIALVGELY